MAAAELRHREGRLGAGQPAPQPGRERGLVEALVGAHRDHVACAHADSSPAPRRRTRGGGGPASKPEYFRIEPALPLECRLEVLGAPEAVALALEGHVGVGHPAAREGLHHRLGLRRGHDAVVEPLEEDQRPGEARGVMHGRALAVEIGAGGPGADQAVEVARLELVGVPRQGLEVADAVVAGPGRELVAEGQQTQRRVASRAAAAGQQARRIGGALRRREARRGGAVGEVAHAPLAAQQVAVGAPVARAAGVVDVDHREAPRGPVLETEAERRRGGARGTAVAPHHEGRALAGAERGTPGSQGGTGRRGRCAPPRSGTPRPRAPRRCRARRRSRRRRAARAASGSRGRARRGSAAGSLRSRRRPRSRGPRRALDDVEGQRQLGEGAAREGRGGRARRGPPSAPRTRARPRPRGPRSGSRAPTGGARTPAGAGRGRGARPRLPARGSTSRSGPRRSAARRPARSPAGRSTPPRRRRRRGARPRARRIRRRRCARSSRPRACRGAPS